MKAFLRKSGSLVGGVYVGFYFTYYWMDNLYYFTFKKNILNKLKENKEKGEYFSMPLTVIYGLKNSLQDLI